MKNINKMLSVIVALGLATHGLTFTMHTRTLSQAMEPCLCHHVESGQFQGAQGYFRTLSSLVRNDNDCCALFGRAPECRRSFFGAQSAGERERAVVSIRNMYDNATFHSQDSRTQAQGMIYPIVRSLIAENSENSLSLLAYVAPIFENTVSVNKEISEVLDGCDVQKIDSLSTHFLTPEQRAVKPPFTIFQDDPKTFSPVSRKQYDESVKKEKQEIAAAQQRRSVLEKKLAQVQEEGPVHKHALACLVGTPPADLLALQLENRRLEEELRQKHFLLRAAFARFC